MEPVVQRGGAATKLGDNLNAEMVSLSAVTTSDVTWLAEALARHHAETGSALAARLLYEWRPATAAVSAALHRAPPLAGLSPSGTTTRVRRYPPVSGYGIRTTRKKIRLTREPRICSAVRTR